MPIVIGVLIALVSIVVITIPFIRRSGSLISERHTSELERLTRLREDFYDQINQLQAAHAANSVSNQDYRDQLLELRIGAAETIRLLDQIGYEDDSMQTLERVSLESLEEEIASMRTSRDSEPHAGNNTRAESDHN